MMYANTPSNGEIEKIRKECGISDDRIVIQGGRSIHDRECELEYYDKENNQIRAWNYCFGKRLFISFYDKDQIKKKYFPGVTWEQLYYGEYRNLFVEKEISSRRYYIICDNTCYEIFINDGGYIEIGNDWDAEDEIIAQNMGFEPSLCWKIYVQNLIKLFFDKINNYEPGDLDEIEEILIKLGDEFDQSYKNQNIVKLAVKIGCDIDVIDMLLEYGFPLPFEQIGEYALNEQVSYIHSLYPVLYRGKEISKDRLARVKESEEYVNRLIRERERAIDANKRLLKTISDLELEGKKFDKSAFEKYISDGASLSYKDENGNNLLHHAIYITRSKLDFKFEEGMKAVKAIIDITGSDLVYEKNNAGYTPFEAANALHRRGEIKKLLVDAHSKKQGDIKKILESRVMRNPVELLTIVNPEKPAWPKDRVAWLIGAGLVTSIAHGIYKNRVRQASTGEEARRISWYYWGFMGAAVVGAYILYGDKIREMSPSRNPRIRRGDVEWVESVKNGRPIWFAYVGDEFIGEIGTYKSEDGFRYRLADEWVWSPSDSFEEAVDGLIDDIYGSIKEVVI